MNPQAISFVAALVLALAAALWRVVAQSEPETTKLPSTKAPTVEVLSASPPVIPPFAKFYVNELNPFVPYQQRMQQVERMNAKPAPPPPPPVKVAPPPKVVVRDPLVLPKLSRARDAVPQCVGLVATRRGDARAIMVRMDAGEASQAVKIGDEVSGWRLDAIDGPTVRWTAPSGESRTFLVAPASRNAVEVVPHNDAAPTSVTPPAPIGGDAPNAPLSDAPEAATPQPAPATEAPKTGDARKLPGLEVGAPKTTHDPGVKDDPLPAQPPAEPLAPPAEGPAPAK